MTYAHLLEKTKKTCVRKRELEQAFKS